jgi:hypothetical protein
MSKYTYLFSLFKNQLEQNILVVPIFSFCTLLVAWSPYFSLPIYPDEVAYQLLTGRWFQEGFRPMGLNGLCHPEGVLIPPIFWLATISTSIVQALVYGLRAERIYPMILLSTIFATTIWFLTQKVRLKSLAVFPVAIAAFGMLPAQIQLLRPEFIWICLAMLLVICSLSREIKSGALANLSIAVFYVGSYLHPEFILLAPAIILNFTRQKTRLYIKIFAIALIVFCSISSLGYWRDLAKCSEFSTYQSVLSRLSTPSLSWSFAHDSIANLLFPTDSVNVSPLLKMIYALPDLKMSQSFRSMNYYYACFLLGLFLVGVIVSFLFILDTITKKLRNENNTCKTNAENQVILFSSKPSSVSTEIDLTLISFIYLAGFFLVFLDPNHLFYRNLAFFITGSFCLAIYIDYTASRFKLSKFQRFPISIGIIFLPILMAVLSTVYSFGYVLPELMYGYAGPSIPLKVWHNTIDSKKLELIHQTLQVNPSRQKIIVDDYTYRIARSRYKEIYPITYLRLMMEVGNIPVNVISYKLNGTPVISICGYESILPIKLLSPPVPIPEYRDLCIGQIDKSLISPQQ